MKLTEEQQKMKNPNILRTPTQALRGRFIIGKNGRWKWTLYKKDEIPDEAIEEAKKLDEVIPVLQPKPKPKPKLLWL